MRAESHQRSMEAEAREISAASLADDQLIPQIDEIAMAKRRVRIEGGSGDLGRVLKAGNRRTESSRNYLAMPRADAEILRCEHSYTLLWRFLKSQISSIHHLEYYHL